MKKKKLTKEDILNKQHRKQKLLRVVHIISYICTGLFVLLFVLGLVGSCEKPSNNFRTLGRRNQINDFQQPSPYVAYRLDGSYINHCTDINTILYNDSMQNLADYTSISSGQFEGQDLFGSHTYMGNGGFGAFYNVDLTGSEVIGTGTIEHYWVDGVDTGAKQWQLRFVMCDIYFYAYQDNVYMPRLYIYLYTTLNVAEKNNQPYLKMRFMDGYGNYGTDDSRLSLEGGDGGQINSDNWKSLTYLSFANSDMLNNSITYTLQTASTKRYQSTYLLTNSYKQCWLTFFRQFLINEGSIYIGGDEETPTGGQVITNGTSTGGLVDCFNMLTFAFASVSPLLNIQVLPNITFGTLLFLPLVVLIIICVIKVVKK